MQCFQPFALNQSKASTCTMGSASCSRQCFSLTISLISSMLDACIYIFLRLRNNGLRIVGVRVIVRCPCNSSVPMVTSGNSSFARLSLSQQIPSEIYNRFHPKTAKVYVMVRQGMGWSFTITKPGYTVNPREATINFDENIMFTTERRHAMSRSIQPQNEVQNMTRDVYRSTELNNGRYETRIKEMATIKFIQYPTSTGPPNPNGVFYGRTEQWSWAEPICMAFATIILNDDIGRECYTATSVTRTPLHHSDRMSNYEQQAFEVTLVNDGDCANHELFRTL